MIEVLPETGSTNADLAARIAAGTIPREGDWLLADRQISGRGRLGRTWFDGSGNFMGSTAVLLGPGDPPPASLALVAAVALHEAVSPLIPPPRRAEIKWPNDVLIDGAKLSGILLERVGGHVIVGIGVNLARAPQLIDRTTTTLSLFGPAPDRDLFAARLADFFAAELALWRSAGLEAVIARWLAAAHPLGTPLVLTSPDQKPLAGKFDGLTSDGALQLRLADGTRQVIHAGEVNLAAPGEGC